VRSSSTPVNLIAASDQRIWRDEVFVILTNSPLILEAQNWTHLKEKRAKA
jgi:hypothetical protein